MMFKTKALTELFAQTKTDALDILNMIPDKTISEGIVKRDNFFHTCWMLLKRDHPELYKEMAEIEMLAAGIDPEPEPEEEKDDVPEGTIRTIL